MQHPPFPLAEDHCYAPGVNGRRHDGSQGMEGLWLAQAQRALRLRWRFSTVTTSGHVDASTQSAVAMVQKQMGYDQTGYLDKPTWDAIFEVTPQKEPHPS